MSIRALLSYVLLTIGSIIVAFPLLMALSYSLMSESQIATFPPPIVPVRPTLNNYADVLDTIPIGRYLLNSFVVSTAVVIGQLITASLAAYAFSRFKIRLKDDLMFFILSTRFMPPIAVAIPVYLMYRQLGMTDTHVGMILLYTAVNVSLAVWLLKGFIDEIPREYEEAALVDGYTRLQAFVKTVLPQASTGIAATAIFCLIFAWNEYAFAVLLTSGEAQTMPPFIPFIIGEGGQDWPAVAAATTIFVVPIFVFTVLLRKHLLRGITFGAVRK